jgi:hypothetical protein
MHCASALSILLVVNVQPEGTGSAELGKPHTVWHHFAIFEEPHILMAKLDSTGLGS